MRRTLVTWCPKPARRLLLGVGFSAAVWCWAWPSWSGEDQAGRYGLGRPATEEEIQRWNIDVGPNGEGLPPGQGTATEGRHVYAAKCAKCHGPTAVEGPFDPLVGGRDTLATSAPIKTIGSYWPYATTLYDYINRAMPYDAPQSMTPDEIYAVIAWLLYENRIIAEDASINARTLPAIEMPNRQGFIPDPRPDVPKPKQGGAHR